MRVREATTTAMGVAGGGRTEAIMREIASLRAQRDELDSRIRFFESQLRVGAAPATLPPSLSTKLDAMGLHAAARGGSGLSPDAVRRYSRHLLLPDFGVQGWFTCKSVICLACSVPAPS
jgi:adenylyltransferase and sulfurtransferase